MSTVTPPPPPPPPVVQTTAQPTAVVSNPPASLSSVAAGTRIDAIIVATTPDGRVEVESRLGRFLISPSVSLPKEGAIQLQVQILARQIFLAITSINGKQPFVALRNIDLNAPPGILSNPTASSINQTGTPSASIRPVSPANSQAGVVVAGSILTATVLKPTNLTNSSANTNKSQNRISSGLTKIDHGSSISGSKVAAAYGNPMIGQDGQAYTSAGKTLNIKVLAINLPTNGSAPTNPISPPSPSTQSSNLALAPGQNLWGTVYSTPSSNATIIQTQTASLGLNLSQSFPYGTTLHIEILAHLSEMNDAARNQFSHLRLNRFLLQTRSWPALDETIDSLRENNPQAALHLINTALPRPNNTLAANLLRFILSVRSGELSNFISEPVLTLLMQTKPELFRRLRDDFRALGRMSEETGTGDWRAVPIPIVNSHAIQQIQLLTRRLPSSETDEENRAGPGTRFIVDVQLSQMGHVQLDGLVHKTRKNFDLVIRSDKHFPDPIQMDIRTIFKEAQEITGTDGWLRFQAAPPRFIDIFDRQLPRQEGLLV